MSERKPMGFWQSISDEEFIDYIKSNFAGKTIGELSETSSRAYLTAKRRGLIDRLVQEKILIRLQRRKGHAECMDDEQLFEYIRENYNGKTISEFEHSDGSLCQKIRDRSLMGKLVQEKVLIRKRQNNLFYQNMTNQEVISFVENHHNGKKIGEAEGGKNGYAITIARERGLIDALVEKGILVRARIEASFSKMTDQELILYIEKNHKGKTVGEFHDTDHSFDLANERGLLDALVQQGIIIRKKRKQGFYTKMSDNELTSYISKNHTGKSITELNRDERTACKIATERSLINSLVEKGILVRKHQSGIFSEMSDEEIVRYIEENYNGKTLAEAQKGKGKQTYIIARQRGLIEPLVSRGILIREHRHGFFSEMSDEQLIDYVTQKYKGKSSKEISDKDAGAYDVLRRKGLIKALVDQGILVQKHHESKYRGMSNESLVSYVKENYSGITLKDLREADPQLANTLYRRRLFDDLTQQGVITLSRNRKSKPIELLEALLVGGQND